jgi:CheY-like chemotaxis protein
MPPTVMVVDDSADELAIIKRVLVKTGRIARVKTAERGEAALALLRDNTVSPALIFIDLKMPGMGGIETVRQLRADEKFKHIPIVILTNSSLDADKKAAYAAGADAFIHKAFNMDQFCEDLKSLLERWLKVSPAAS